MSLRDLARAFLESELARAPQVSHVGHHRGVPVGQSASTPYSSGDSAVPLAVPHGTLPKAMGQAVPMGQCGTGGTNGTLGTVAPAFTPERLQPVADRRNAEALRKGSTDRWCACGLLASCAWPDGRRREIWRCLECGPVRGRA
jgi:hypothetical protein